MASAPPFAAAFKGGPGQARAALELANHVRLERVRLRRELAAGQLSLGDALAHELNANVRITTLLLVLPRYGPIKAGKALARAGLSSSALCGALSDRRRRELVAAVAGEPLELELEAPPLAAPTPLYPPPAIAPDHETSIEALLA